MKKINRNDSRWKRRPSNRKLLSVIDGVRSTKKSERQRSKVEIKNA